MKADKTRKAVSIFRNQTTLKEIDTELAELEHLAEIGIATEQAYNKGFCLQMENDYGEVVASISRNELLEWAKGAE